MTNNAIALNAPATKPAPTLRLGFFMIPIKERIQINSQIPECGRNKPHTKFSQNDSALVASFCS